MISADYPAFYAVNHKFKWACVAISKNACTSVKAKILEDESIPAARKKDIHDKIGYSPSSRFVASISEALSGYRKFAIYRDPVDRFKSGYIHYGIEKYHHPTFKTNGASLGVWMRYLESELRRPILQQDHHVRRQTDYAFLDCIDDYIHIKSLNTYFLDMGWGALPQANKSKSLFNLPENTEARVKEIYKQDYNLQRNLTR